MDEQQKNLIGYVGMVFPTLVLGVSFMMITTPSLLFWIGGIVFIAGAATIGQAISTKKG